MYKIHDFKKRIRISLILILFIFIIIYTFYESRKIVFGVKIKDINIVDYQKITDNPLEIKGNAKNAILITLNGREISIDKEGNWNETLVLLPGYNIINIEAKDKFGHIDKKNFRLISEVTQ